MKKKYTTILYPHLVFTMNTKIAASYAGILALVFLVVASPFVYGVVNNLPVVQGKVVEDGEPTMFGLVLHTIVFFLLALTVLKYVTVTK